MKNYEEVAKVVIAFNPVASKIIDCIDKGVKAKVIKTIVICSTIFLSICVICFTVYLTLGCK